MIFGLVYCGFFMSGQFLIFLVVFPVFDVLSQFAMLYMLLSLSLGWTLASAHCRYSHLKTISRKPASKVVAVLGVMQVNHTALSLSLSLSRSLSLSLSLSLSGRWQALTVATLT